MHWGNERLHVVGLGGTLRANSTSRWALERSLRAAEEAGATTDLLDLNELRLPMYEPDKVVADYDPVVANYLERVRRADAMIWSTAAYNGTLVGATKNALDFLHFLDNDRPPYLHERIVGLIATAGGDIAAVNAINAMVHSVNSLRGTVAPLFVPISQSQNVFDKQGNVVDKKWATRLDQLGKLVVENGSKFHPEPLEIELGA